jgi:AcrR family transcriptional regulator
MNKQKKSVPIEEQSSTRQRILEAALKLFSAKGYLGATTRDLAQEAGIAEITLFRHFSTKEKLFEETLATYSFLPKLRELMPEVEKMSYEEALTTIARKFLELLYERREMVSIVHSEMRRYPDAIHRIFHGFTDETIMIISSYFRQLQKGGLLRDFDAEMGARMFMGMFISFFNKQELMQGKKYRKVDPEKIIREFVNIFAGGTVRR